MAIKNLDDLGKFLDLEEGQKLSELITSDEEVELKVKEGDFYTKEQDTQRIGNYKEEFETAGREKVLKELRDDNELKFDGVKDPKNFVAALTAKVKATTLEEAKIEPDKKIEGLTVDLEKLRGQLGEKDSIISNMKVESQQKDSKAKINKTIFDNLPDKTSLPKEDLAVLFNSKNDVRLNDSGVLELYKNGEVVKDELRNPVDVGKSIAEFGSQYIKAADGGSGGGDSGGNGGAGTIDGFIEEMKGKNISASSEEFNKEMERRIKSGTLKV